MMHELFRRLAQFGGEGALYLLFLMSVTVVAIISERLWNVVRHRTRPDPLDDQLTTAIQAGDLALAQSLVQRSNSSICAIALAGLTQPFDEPCAVNNALQASVSLELSRLRSKPATLRELGRFSVLIGLAGTLLDLLSLSSTAGVQAFAAHVAHRSPLHPVITTLAPAVAGLLVAIPAWLAATLLRVQVQRNAREFDAISRLISSEVTALSMNTPLSRRLAS